MTIYFVKEGPLTSIYPSKPKTISFLKSSTGKNKGEMHNSFAQLADSPFFPLEFFCTPKSLPDKIKLADKTMDLIVRPDKGNFFITFIKGLDDTDRVSHLEHSVACSVEDAKDVIEKYYAKLT
jgi:hypothetical protein